MIVLGALAAGASALAVAAVVVLVRRLRQATARLDEVASRLETLEDDDDGLPAPPVPVAGDDGDGGALTDDDTGLFSEQYFSVALDARLSAARRHLRPVAVVLIDVVEGLADGSPRPSNPKTVAASINATIRDADTACRMADGRFGLVLEDTPENGAIWTVERVRRHLAGVTAGHTLWAGVACYPAHAFDATEILAQAEAALTAAREWRQDRIEVANTP